jgi:hypothetical protein
MTSMVLAFVMTVARYARIFAITVPNVFIELSLTPLHPVGSVSFRFPGFFSVKSKSLSLAERDKAFSFITRFLKASKLRRELATANLAFLGHVIS